MEPTQNQSERRNLNEAIIYSICKLTDNYYVFAKHCSFPIPDKTKIYSHSLPTFTKNMSPLRELTTNITHDILNQMLYHVNEYQDVLDADTIVTNPNASPHKKQKTNSKNTKAHEDQVTYGDKEGCSD